MLSIAIAVLISVQAPQGDSPTQQKPDAASILTKMFARYAVAISVSGTIRMTQTAQVTSRPESAAVHTVTELQFNRPSQIYLHQTRDGSHAGVWLVTSDGKEFSYDPPLDESREFGRRRHVEYVTQHGQALTVGDILDAAAHSIADPNAILEAAAGSKARLRWMLGQWATIVYRGKVEINGQTVQAIRGQYRENAETPISGEFEAFVNESGDFVRYVLHENYSPQGRSEVVAVTTTWDSDLKLNAKTDASLYRVVP